MTHSKKMPRLLVLLVCLVTMAAPSWAATLRLYLKDGTHHTIREYQVEGDRVKYFSTERGDWEELPVELVDLKKTESERVRIDESVKKAALEEEAEEKAEREFAKEIRRVPREPGVYLVDEELLKPMPQADVKLVSDKKRSFLKTITQIPLNGKATIEVANEHSAQTVRGRRPDFWVRLKDDVALVIVKLEPSKKGSRIVEKVSIVPVVKEMVEEREVVETFRRQFAEGLYKLWPTKDLEPGEYAVVTFVEGKGDPQVWDFRVE